jgi:hypothetical protein
VKMIPSEPRDSRALTALVERVSDATNPPSEVELARGLNALRRRVFAEHPPRRRSRLRWSIVALALVACIGLGSAGISLLAPRSMEHPVRVTEVQGGKILSGGYLSESGHGGIKLSFNEGSLFALTPGTRGRLSVVANEGARLALDHGTASFRITHRPEHRWSVEAGPFLVTVKGTDFTVSWDPASEQFEVLLRRGRVAVSGPVLGEDIVLKAGQRLRVSLPRAETVITEDPPAEAAASATAAPLVSGYAPPVASGNAKPPSGSSAPAATAASALPSERRWREALANGEWDRILAEVDRAGVEVTLQGASSSDLFALADAARYRRRTDLARSALLAQRRRFPASQRSLDAIFLLGRVEESHPNGHAQAIRWYDEYLSQAPAGTYAAEALGRKMILTNELQGPAQARQVAEEYLRRFPRGSYAGTARALQRSP